MSLCRSNASGVASFADGGGATTVGFFVIFFLTKMTQKEYLYRTTYFFGGGWRDTMKPSAGAKQAATFGLPFSP